MTKEKKTPTNYDLLVIELLENQELAAEYLSEVLSNFKKDGKVAQKILLNALKDIASAQGGLSNVAKTTGSNTESLSKALSERGNLQLDTLLTLLEALGFEMHIKVASRAENVECDCSVAYTS